MGLSGSARSLSVFGKSSTERERVHKPCIVPGVQGTALKIVKILKYDLLLSPGAALPIHRLCLQNTMHSQNVPGCFHVTC